MQFAINFFYLRLIYKLRVVHKSMSSVSTKIKKSNTAAVFISEFGLGPYPEIPEGWPGGGFVNNLTIEHELMERVQMKIFADTGVYYSGATMDDTGLVKLSR